VYFCIGAYFIYQFFCPFIVYILKVDIQWLTTILLVMTYGSGSSKGSFLKNANHALRLIIIRLAAWKYETNPALWLATQVGRMVPSCQLGITHYVPRENSILSPYDKYFINQACSFFFPVYKTVYKTSILSRSLNTRKNTWPISWLHGWSVTQI